MRKNRKPSRKTTSRLPSRRRASRSILPDDVSKMYKRRKVSLMVKVLPEKNREGLPSILFEGNRASLEWLADSILAQARDMRDCSFLFGPDGPGNLFFTRNLSSDCTYIACHVWRKRRQEGGKQEDGRKRLGPASKRIS